MKKTLQKAGMILGVFAVGMGFAHPSVAGAAKKVAHQNQDDSAETEEKVEKTVKKEISKYVGYDKGVYLKTADDKFKVKINLQLQPQYQFLSIESRPGTANPRDNVNTFQMRRARLVFSGHAFDKDLTYKFQLEAVSGRSSTTGENIGVTHTGPNLRDAYVNYKVNDHFEIRGGQFKGAFNREEMTSSTNLQFVDRSVNNEVFNQGRDLGVMLHGKFGAENKFEYAVYAQNEGGNNRNNFNVNNEMLFGGRLIYNILGNHGYTQSDVTTSEDPQLVIGFAPFINVVGRGGEDKLWGLSSDVAFKYRRFSLVGEFNYAGNTTDNRQIFGYFGQVGYFVIPEKLEIAARAAGVVPTDAFVANGYEYGGCLNYFFRGHNVKIQTDYSLLVNSALVYNGANAATNFMIAGNNPGFIQNQTDHRIRTQVQVYF